MEVLLDDPAKAESVSRQIDEMFGHEQVATQTKTHMAFVTSATGDLLALVRFTRYLGLLCVLLVLALTMNTVYVAVQERVREHAVLQTIGFSGARIFGMVVTESSVLTLMGGIVGTLLAVAALHWGYFALSAEGINISFVLSPQVIIAGLAASLLTGVAAGVFPALVAATTPTVEALRRA
jgi:putative ABC transport system permease protein